MSTEWERFLARFLRATAQALALWSIIVVPPVMFVLLYLYTQEHGWSWYFFSQHTLLAAAAPFVFAAALWFLAAYLAHRSIKGQ